MTVLIREDLNESALLWAAADLAVAGAQGQALRARVAAARMATSWPAPASNPPAQAKSGLEPRRSRP